MSCFNVNVENRSLGISGGYMGISLTWKQWVRKAPKEVRPVLKAFLEFIQRSKCYGESAQTISQNRKVGLYWKFYIGNDVKWEICFSWRGWGDFMAAAENICEEMGYMNYYC